MITAVIYHQIPGFEDNMTLLWEGTVFGNSTYCAIEWGQIETSRNKAVKEYSKRRKSE